MGIHYSWSSTGFYFGPLLILIYINDIKSDIKSTIKLFADKISLYLIVDTPNNAANLLNNNDLETIHRWAET